MRLGRLTISPITSQSHGPVGHIGLRGRARECALLDELIAAVRRGECRSLMLRGEAGIGKTALLDYLTAAASELAVVRAVGVESEMELAYSSLHQLCAPLLGKLDRLPAPQRQAVEVVFGISSGTAPDRFLVGLGVLSLVSEVAEERPLQRKAVEQVACQRDRALQERGCGRLTATRLRPAGRELQLTRHAFVWPGGSSGQMPGMAIRIDAPIRRVRQRWCRTGRRRR